MSSDAWAIVVGLGAIVYLVCLRIWVFYMDGERVLAEAHVEPSDPFAELLKVYDERIELASYARTVAEIIPEGVRDEFPILGPACAHDWRRETAPIIGRSFRGKIVPMHPGTLRCMKCGLTRRAEWVQDALTAGVDGAAWELRDGSSIPL
jgi:hypothetical protein